ncbi:MAG: DUF1993 domain-containing protein [Parasphingorhabdus sp.]|uniref:DUF1993 domain-containing protein n=1 Tax=Parasphingorhabdus sp. TaxID=2709688 RepID=UPI003001E5AD
MAIALSQIFKSSTDQAFRGLTNILEKAKDHAETTGTPEEAFLNNRLFPDMHDMKWQVQMITEFAVRGAARMTGIAPDDLPNLPMEGDSFDALIARIDDCAKTFAKADNDLIDSNKDLQISMPIGPGKTMDISGQNYVLNFFLPNLFFHVTTAYNLLRMQGVAVGKKDYMGM